MSRPRDWQFLDGAADVAAQRLLGCELQRSLGGHTLRGRIVETEAYDQSDAASHSYKGRTPRTEVMFGAAGMLYVYFTYGMHYCCNIVVGPVGRGAAVLIRALEPTTGMPVMARRRQGAVNTQLTNGPAKLCQALAIDKALNGHDLTQPPLRLRILPPVEPSEIVQTVRVGISRSVEMPCRFYLKDNRFVSQK